MNISGKEWRDIGGEFVFEQLTTLSPYGARRKAEKKIYRPSEREELEQELDAVDALLTAYTERPSSVLALQYDFMRAKDIRRSIERVQKGGVLEDLELFELKLLLDVIHELHRKYPDLETDLPCELIPLDALRERLDPEKSGRLTFYIYDAYSKRLTLLRRHQREIEDKIAKEEDFLAKEELLRERSSLLIAQEKEEREVRVSLSAIVQKEAATILENMDALGRLDHRIAKALLASKWGGCRPTILEESGIQLREANHPLLSDILTKKGESFQKLSLSLRPGVSVITGANMGGKSVSLKTMLLNTFLIHLGMFPFAKEASSSLFDFFYYLGDDLEDIGQGLSSFGAEILSLSDVFTRSRTQKGCIILDEPLRGTNPREGRAILLGYLRRFTGTDNILAVSTHFESLVEEGMAHYQVRGLRDVDFTALAKVIETDRQAALSRIRKSMNFSLEEVEAGEDIPRDALRISELLGLDPSLIEDIQNLL